MQITHLFAGIPTGNLAAALAWYERLLGRPPDRLPHEHEAVWQLVDDALIYVVLDPERAGRGLLTLIVDDIEAWADGVRGRGVAIGTIDEVPGLRRTTITDPDGNRIQIGQVG